MSESSATEQIKVRNTVRFGFAAVLGLTFVLGVIGLYQLNATKHSISTIVEVGNEKIALAIKMRDAIRLRALATQRIASTSDYFKRDQELQNFYQYSGMYRDARGKLVSMDMTVEEKQIHDTLQRLTRLAQPINREAAEMLLMDPLPDNFSELHEKAIGIQNQLLGLLDQFVKLQEDYSKQLVEGAREKYESTVIMMIAVVGLILLIGSIIARRVTHLVTIKNTELAMKNKELEAAWFEAANATHAKSKFLASMSHEIRTPLTSIIGFAETLGEPSQMHEDLVHSAEAIKRSGNHLYQIINDVLDISKIEAGQIELELVPMSPTGIVMETSSMISDKIRKKGVDFRTNFFFPLPKQINADPTRVRQILLNLLSNAAKFTNEGIICINTYYLPDEHLVKYEISDTGIGMTPDGVNKVFEPFAQAEKSTTRRFGGTGLGLSISKQLAEKLGGDIVCESEKGVGSTFTVTISTGGVLNPELIYEVDKTEMVNEQNKNVVDHKKLDGHVLLAEDVIENQKLISMHIRKTGARVTVVGDGKEALKEGLTLDYDLILMDMQMPIMDGLEATRLLRSNGYGGPIIVLTANESKTHREMCAAAGATGFLSKPINFETFRGVLNDHLQEKKKKEVVIKQHYQNDSDSEEDEIQKIVQSFLLKLPDMINSIRQCAENEDWERLHSVAHQLKGLGGSFGYYNITNISKKIMECVQQHSENLVKDYIEQLQQEYADIKSKNSDERKVG